MHTGVRPMTLPIPEDHLHQLTGAIRRMIRVLGSQPMHASRPGDVVAASRLVQSRLMRAGIATRWIEGTAGTPLLVAGNGPIAVVTYLDDNHPGAVAIPERPPEISGDLVLGTALERKAATIAHLATMLSHPDIANQMTLIVESDRQSGSHTLEEWLESASPRYAVAAWEATDLPLSPPVVIRSATGTIIARLTLNASRRRAEPVYGTVLPDLGIAMSNLLTSLKSVDDEVLIEGFYDGIETPDSDELDVLIKVGPGVSRWLGTVAGDERELSTSHMTLGMFCAPSVVVRELSMQSSGDYLPESASAIVEFQILPGQSVKQTLELIRSNLQTGPFSLEIEPLLVRPPVVAARGINLPAEVASLSIAPGLTPASCFARAGTPTVGYALVGRTTGREVPGVSISAIAYASQFLETLVATLGSDGRSMP